ncbi:ABC transporter ATP-binding protein [Dichelobacter nodosus]|uniref:ABC transporter domain protein n=1 Tax=Dichelobacter nodosus (strain VCS1703A) TaxID=246195 RepID=A5EVT7_DICNV|nr:ABC transporter ATP-binding protein [Dichelobacter nodosus]ABQ14126.1 ABC transporter domain protein [Dichelobacter nodosus VCS1703A]AXM45331.1 ABC transporter ATP-binding protein [Dichelobacter nodosus]KNZ40056.1 ABC transporter ATP-binding protein [Dichelobacter nodosus]TGA65054.1 ABC transporter ATP-binding protein [Dichelobacter nodosus]
MNIYKKLFSYVPDEKPIGYLAIIVSGISAFLTVCGYYYIYLFFYDVMVSGNFENASASAIKIVICLTASAVLYILSGLASHKLAFRLETNLRKRGIDGLLDSGFRFFDLNSSGYIRKTIDDNAAKTHTAVAHMLPDNMQAFLVPIFTLLLSFVISFHVGIVIIILTIVSALILKGMMGSGEFMKLYQDSLDKLSCETVEYIRGMQVVKIYGSKLNSFKAFYEAIMNYSKYAYDYSISCKKPYVIYQLIFLGLIAIITIPLSLFLSDFSNTKILAVELIMIFFLSGVMMVSFMKIMWASQNIFSANYAVDNLEALYKKMQEDKLFYGKREHFDNSNIEFNNVSFSYGDNRVLENLSFSLREKKTYALVGHSGSGKSTIAKLLSGFYKVDSGVIEIGGHPLQEYTKEAIIKNISFVFQDSKLFKKTIYENVALADENAKKEEVMEAMSLAGCDEIISKLKEKENTVIGTKGVYLSGGEKQRIAIARAILKKSPIVIMDEASASIDADNEYKLQKAFKNLMKDKTVIVIAHRMTSIKNVDEIIVLENGKIIQRGSNEELRKRQGLYNKLLSLYEAANEWRVSNEELL